MFIDNEPTNKNEELKITFLTILIQYEWNSPLKQMFSVIYPSEWQFSTKLKRVDLQSEGCQWKMRPGSDELGLV